MAQKSIFEKFGYEVTSSKSASRKFPIVEGSKAKFSARELKGVTQCCLRTTSYDNSESTTLKLHIEGTHKGKSFSIWAKLDSVSYKRYKDSGNADIDPSMIVLYQEYDPEKEYGSKKKNYAWNMVRVKDGAIVAATLDDSEFFDEECDVPF